MCIRDSTRDDVFYQSLDSNFPNGVPETLDDNDPGTTYVPTSIGPRELVVLAEPEIFIVQESYDPAYVVNAGATINAFAGATYANLDISTAASVSTLDATWQYSTDYDEFLETGTWNDFTLPASFVDEADYSETQDGAYEFTTGSFADGSNLVIANISANFNGPIYYRAKFSSTLPDPPEEKFTNPFSVILTPEITIITQPGVAATDTGPTAFGWGTGNPSNGVGVGQQGGDVRVSIQAQTTAGVGTLTYNWQFRVFDAGFYDGTGELLPFVGIQNTWIPFFNDEIANIPELNGYFVINSGGTTSDAFFEIYQLKCFDVIQFRCVVEGQSGEISVTSDAHTLLMRDSAPDNSQVVLSPVGTVTDNEDYYGDVANRENLTEYPIRFQQFDSTVDISLYQGIDGNLSIQWQKSTDGGASFFDVGEESQVTSLRRYNPSYTSQISDGTIPELEDVIYQTIPYRVDDPAPGDNGAQYRLAIYSSAVFQYDEVANPIADPTARDYTNARYFSPVGPTLDLYREIFILVDPATAEIFVPNSASFEVTATATSNIPNLVYQWQYSPGTNGIPDDTWSNLSNGPLFGVAGENEISGSQTTTLVINNTTVDLDRSVFFRVIVDYDPADVPGALSSRTSAVATVNVRPDSFTQITTINDIFIDEFQNAEWTVSATSLSLGDIAFEWQRSTDFAQLGINANWSAVTALPGGGTPLGVSGSIVSGGSTTFTLSNATTVDQAYYRVQMTSTGGIVAESSIAELTISVVDIDIVQDLEPSYSIIEGQDVVPFEVDAVSTIGSTVLYQYQYRKVGDPSFINFGLSATFQPSTTNPYQPVPFFKNDNWDDALLRVQYSIDTGFTKNGIESDLIIRRQFYYFAESALVQIVQNNSFSIDLRSDQTGPDFPSFEWEYSINGGTSWSSVNDLGAVNNQEILFIADVNDVNGININGALFRCEVTLNLIDEMVYSRNNNLVIDTTNPGGSLISNDGFGYTVNVELQIIDEPIKPIYYGTQIAKTGASVGTVICIPKPPEFVNDNDSATNDDIFRWGCAITGLVQAGDRSSIRNAAFGTNTYTVNRAYLNRTGRGIDWIDEGSYLFNAGAGEVPNDFFVPKWRLEDDRFPGFIELRGQWLIKEEFPLLYEIIGDEFGETTTEFRLPNPYGKRMMGTGAVNGRTGRTSVIPNFNPDGTSGGDFLQPGTVGGVFTYERSRQLPPGSPGLPSEPDGTAGLTDPGTFTLGSYRTDGWEEAETISFPVYTGQFTYTVGPLFANNVVTPAVHNHSGVAVGPAESFAHGGGCRNGTDNRYKATSPGSGNVLAGPAGIPEGTRGREHNHGISKNFVTPGNNKSQNEGTGKGDTSAPSSITETVNINFSSGSSLPSLNAFLDTMDVALSRASRNEFDNALTFYLRNSEQVPIIANYYRVKWLIKAY